MSKQDTSNERELLFSKIFLVRDLKAKETLHHFEADDEEKKVLTERFGLKELEQFSAKFVIDTIEEGRLFNVKMNLKAKAVAFLNDNETLDIEIDDSEEELLTTDKELSGDEEELDLYSPELITNGEIDLGDMAADYMYLMIDEKLQEAIFALGEQEQGDEDGEIDISVKDTHRPFANLQEMLDEKK